MCVFNVLIVILKSFLDIGHPVFVEYFKLLIYTYIHFSMIKYMQILWGYIERILIFIDIYIIFSKFFIINNVSWYELNFKCGYKKFKISRIGTLILAGY